MKYLILLLIVCAIQVGQAQNTDVNVSSSAIKNNDGRFTLGNGDQRMMYGFPIPFSTSHFVLSVDDFFLTNNPIFSKRKKTIYLKGTTTFSESAAPTVTTEYQYKKYIIKQILTPLDKDLKDLKAGTPQYYKVTISIKNENENGGKVGLLMLFDTMIDDNDACRMGIGKNKVEECTSYKGITVPNQVYVYKNPDDKKALIAELKPYLNEKGRPSEMHIGNWPQFYSIQWNVPDQGKGKKYYDSAILLKWGERDIKVGDEVIFECAYGIPKFMQSELSLVVAESNLKTKFALVYFDLGSASIDLNGEMNIRRVIESTRNIKGATIHGYSDAYGGDEGALELSQKRIETVEKILTEYNIKCIPKAHGNYDSDFSEESVKKGNVKDRKVFIEVLYSLE